MSLTAANHHNVDDVFTIEGEFIAVETERTLL